MSSTTASMTGSNRGSSSSSIFGSFVRSSSSKNNAGDWEEVPPSSSVKTSTSTTANTSTGDSSSLKRTKTPDELINDALTASLGTDESTTVLVKYALMSVGFLTVFRIVSSSLFYISLLVFPLAYIMLKQTCPTRNSFDIKKELRPILEKSQQEYPMTAEKEQESSVGYFSKWWSSTKASLQTEYATFWGNIQVEFFGQSYLGNMAVLCSAHCPTLQKTYYWIGIHGKWYYLYSTTSNGVSTTDGTMDDSTTISRLSILASSTASAAMAVAAASLSSSTATAAATSTTTDTSSSPMKKKS